MFHLIPSIIHFAWFGTDSISLMDQNNIIYCKKKNPCALVVLWYNSINYTCYCRLRHNGILPINITCLKIPTEQLNFWSNIIKTGNSNSKFSGNFFGTQTPAGVKDMFIEHYIMNDKIGGFYFDLDVQVENLEFDKNKYNSNKMYEEFFPGQKDIVIGCNSKLKIDSHSKKWTRPDNYIMKQTKQLAQQGESYEGLSPESKSGANWKNRIYCEFIIRKRCNELLLKSKKKFNTALFKNKVLTENAITCDELPIPAEEFNMKKTPYESPKKNSMYIEKIAYTGMIKHYQQVKSGLKNDIFAPPEGFELKNYDLLSKFLK